MLPVNAWRHLPDYRFGASTGSTSTDHAKQAGLVYHRRLYAALALNAQVSLAAAGWKLLVEPWFQERGSGMRRSPDAVLLNAGEALALVIEAKKNWADGRDRKLLDVYLPLVASAFGVKTRPCLITGNVRGLQHQPLLGLSRLLEALSWVPGQPTPVLLVPKP